MINKLYFVKKKKKEKEIQRHRPIFLHQSEQMLWILYKVALDLSTFSLNSTRYEKRERRG